MGYPTIRTVAKQADVSIATVSYYLNNPGRLSDATREKVKEAIEFLGYTSDQRARQLSTGGSNLIGLLLEDVENPFFGRLARGVARAASQRGYMVVLGSKSHIEGSADFYLDAFERNRFSGIILALADPGAVSGDHIARLRRMGVRVARVGVSDDDSVCAVSADGTIGGRLAAEHLLSLGHRRIAVVSPSHGYKACDERVAGFLSYIEEHAHEPVEVTRVDVPGLSIEAGEQVFAEVIRSDASAVFCVSDLLAVGLVHTAPAHGVVVPGDLAVVGYDDMDYATSTSPRLTSIHQPVGDIGEAVAELILDEVLDPDNHVHSHRVFSPQLVVRESSTRTPAIAGATDAAVSPGLRPLF